MANVYKSKKGFMPLGMLAIAVAVSIAGCLLSFLYLKINQFSPNVWLCILVAVGFGALMGGIAYFLIKVMKIRNQLTALIGIIIGCLVFTVFKWALYVQWDNEKIMENNPKAWEYCQFYFDFTKDGTQYGDICSDDEIRLIIAVMKDISAYDYLSEYYYGGASAYIKDLEKYNGRKTTMEELKDTDSFEYFYGDYVKKGKEVESITTAYKMDTDEYFEDYLDKDFSAMYYITHPAEFWEYIEFVNGYGRWSISSSSSSYSATATTENNNVKGIMLWIVWVGEILCMCIPAIVIAYGRADKPFIEFENDWAELNASDGFMLRAPAVVTMAGKTFKANPDSIFMYEHLNSRPGTASFLKLEIYHSKAYDENYANLVLMNFVPKNKNYSKSVVAKQVSVSKDFVYRFFEHCGQDAPFVYTPDYTQAPTMQAVNDPSDIFNQKISRPVAPAPSGAMDEVAVPVMADEKSQEDVLKELNS